MVGFLLTHDMETLTSKPFEQLEVLYRYKYAWMFRWLARMQELKQLDNPPLRKIQAMKRVIHAAIWGASAQTLKNLYQQTMEL